MLEPRPGYPAIEDHGVIGDLHTVALVGCDGCIDFLCFPRFDSPSIFAALLDRARGGYFLLAPVLEEAKNRQMYLPDTNVLLTRFLSDQGVGEVSDYMPVEEVAAAHNVVRRAKTVRGEVCWRMVCAPRFDYGRAPHRLEVRGQEAIFASGGPDGLVLRLRADVPLRAQDGAAVAEATLPAGRTASFVLEMVRPGEPSPSDSPHFVAEAFKATVNFWRDWLRRSTYRGRWRETVGRSALTLKLLTHEPTGAIVASPTFGLPEQVGGGRNWDYRYTWIRDASFTLYALIRLGFTAEAGAFMRWLEARCGELEPDGSPLRIVYGIDGRHRLDEEELPHLEGYRGSRPVRVGNDAWRHLQLDIYGELLDSVYLYDKHGEPISIDLWRSVAGLVDWLCENWRMPDESIWEVRGGRREFLYSRLMSWVALDRALRIAARRSFPAPLARWREVRDAIYLDVMEAFWDPELGAFVQVRGRRSLDAASLLMPLVRFLSPVDPRWLSTLRAIERELLDDSLVYRYKLGDEPIDGLEGEEGTFSMCTFWYVECLGRTGDLEQARFFFEKMLGYASQLGFYGEELGPRGEHLGNFPQAFTHLALISAAFDLDRRLDAAGSRA